MLKFRSLFFRNVVLVLSAACLSSCALQTVVDSRPPELTDFPAEGMDYVGSLGFHLMKICNIYQ
jgi:hypothetical protein